MNLQTQFGRLFRIQNLWKRHFRTFWSKFQRYFFANIEKLIFLSSRSASASQLDHIELVLVRNQENSKMLFNKF